MYNHKTWANTPGILPPTTMQEKQTTEGEMVSTEGEQEVKASEGEEHTSPTWYDTPRAPRATKRRRSIEKDKTTVPGGARADRARARESRKQEQVRVAQETTSKQKQRIKHPEVPATRRHNTKASNNPSS